MLWYSRQEGRQKAYFPIPLSHREMFQIDHVRRTNGLTQICMARDHQLEITNVTNAIEQVAPQRSFTGTDHFEIALSASAG
jgi:hypothetical protein